MRRSLLCLLFAASCQISFSDDLTYICANDFECGGGGYVCAAGVCCLATGPEICGDGKDNDCDGVDTECHATTEYSTIVSSTRPEPLREIECVAASEDCSDGVDNDCDELTDCEDPACSGGSCGLGCVCAGGRKTEYDCADGLDNDGDGAHDCGDEVDCPAGSSCTRPNNGRAGLCQAMSKVCN
jgi:hypothetical protein